MMVGKHRMSVSLREELGESAAEAASRVLDTKTDSVAIISTSGLHLDVNARLKALLGYEPEQVLGKTPDALYWPKSMREKFAEIFSEGDGFAQDSFRTVLRHKDGRELEVQAEIIRYGVETFGKQIFVARFREAGEDAVRDRALRESEERYRALSEYSPYGILVHSGGKIHYVNKAAVTMWGGPREELLASSLLTMVHPDSRDEVLKRIAAMMGSEGTVPTIREKLLRRDGTMFHADVLGTPIPFDGEHAVQLVIRDVTEEEDRAARLAQAERLEAIGNLTSSVAHDFNNLLTVVISSCALAARRCPENRALQSDLNAAQFAAKRGGALTKQLLAFGRKQETTNRSVLLSDVILEISLLLNKLLGDSIEWSLDTGPDLWASHVNALQVEQVIMNLASNAKIAMPDGGRLKMDVRNVEIDSATMYERERGAGLEPGLYVALRFTDNGIGMDENTRSRIFEKSFTTGADRGGSGLGLATVYSIVRDSGGAILVDSNPGEGTEFTLYFPSSVAVNMPIPLSLPIAEPKRGDETILLVEDQEPVRRATRAILELHGYRVVEADGVRMARAIIGDMVTSLDLVLSDVMLGDGTGPEVIEEALRLRPGLAVLYMSGFASSNALQARVLSSDVPVLAKPFLPTEICDLVRSLLDAQR